MAASPAETRVYLFHLPAELYRQIASYLKKDTLKNLRVTCSTLSKLTPFIIDRVFISANSINLQVFRAIADSETFRHNVTEIVWDDARLSTGPEDMLEEDLFFVIGDPGTVVTDNGCPFWFKARRQDTDVPEFSGQRNPPDYNTLSVEASWDYYKNLLEDQCQILQTSTDIDALKYGLRRFPNLKRVTVTPSTHGNIGQPMYQTPMIRAFPCRFDYPLPKEWPFTKYGEPREAYAWIPDEDPDNFLESCESFYNCNPEEYRAKWRGIRVVLRTLVECGRDHNVTELIIGGTEILTGLNCRLFDQPCQEYDDLVTMLQRPGFRRLDLDLFTGLNEMHNWKSFRSGLLRKALSEAKELRHVSIRTTTNTAYGEVVSEWPGMVPDEPFPLRTVFPIHCWPKLEHFGISSIQVTNADVLSFLAALPYSARSVELSRLAWADEGEHYDTLLNNIRTKLDWCSRPAGERPRLHVTTPLIGEGLERGSYVEMDDAVHSFLYGDGKNPFKRCADGIQVGGGIQKNVFDLEVSVSYDSDWYKNTV
ncbi:hypothetical protein FIE12Z_5921 [Fusarium flagelliforme]|uniref:F-box domain-containing protein n=1 Tax=Fusarium flagelliforme TaxID=2675880 RepID=A0A395MQS9_9HYPO|nr:hypothetical protein FIE12Z_5921 [Fusarium flagelliforme]